MSQFLFGFVYVMTNATMPELVKIGRTNRLAEDRADELFTTGLPVPFEIVFRALSSNPEALEKEVHRMLESKRLKKNREFFTISPEEASETILLARRKTDGINSSFGKTVLLCDGDRVLLSLLAGQILILSAYPTLNSPEADIIDLWQAHTDGDTLELYCTDKGEYTSGFSENDAFSENDPVPFLNRTGTADNDILNGRERLVPGDRLLWVDDSSQNGIASVIFELKTYCQIVARTRQPLLLDDWSPLLINMVTRSELSPEILNAGRELLQMPIPRNWRPRQIHENSQWIQAAEREAPNGFWLTQLGKSSRNLKK